MSRPLFKEVHWGQDRVAHRLTVFELLANWDSDEQGSARAHLPAVVLITVLVSLVLKSEQLLSQGLYSRSVSCVIGL